MILLRIPIHPHSKTGERAQMRLLFSSRRTSDERCRREAVTTTPLVIYTIEKIYQVMSSFSGFARRAASATGRRSGSMMATLLQQRRLPRKAILERMLLLALSIVIFATVIASISITIGGLERSSRRTHGENDGESI